MNQRQLSFGEAVKQALVENYCSFTGRASRSEYWWYALFAFIVGSVVAAVFSFNDTVEQVMTSLCGLALLLPGLGVSIRRLHDTGRSGWWVLINLIPAVGWIVFLVFAVQPSQPSANEYGPVPNQI